MEKQDIDKLELAARAGKGLVSDGEKIMKDGEINLADLQYAPSLAKNLGDFVRASAAYKEMIAEAKDIDPSEAVKLVQIMFS